MDELICFPDRRELGDPAVRHRVDHGVAVRKKRSDNGLSVRGRLWRKRRGSTRRRRSRNRCPCLPWEPATQRCMRSPCLHIIFWDLDGEAARATRGLDLNPVLDDIELVVADGYLIRATRCGATSAAQLANERQADGIVIRLHVLDLDHAVEPNSCVDPLSSVDGLDAQPVPDPCDFPSMMTVALQPYSNCSTPFGQRDSNGPISSTSDISMSMTTRPPSGTVSSGRSARTASPGGRGIFAPAVPARTTRPRPPPPRSPWRRRSPACAPRP